MAAAADDLGSFPKLLRADPVKRVIDLGLSAVLLVAAAPLLLVIAATIKATSPGPVLFRTRRVGRDNRLFTMLKFRTMRIDTPQVATHLLEQPDRFLTPVGGFLRRTSLDELPQLMNVLRGDMSLVGPRPALFNQHDLVELRTRHGVQVLLPGVTGWAQVNGRDNLSTEEKVVFDAEYLRNRGLSLDLRILFLTLQRVARADSVAH
jgi:O-antigen biosynthesis protein WbqP